MCAWVKIDDQFADHPKVLEVGPLAECLFVRGLTYASRYLTDGFVPASHLRRMGDLNAIEEAGKLVAAGLWHEAENGYRIHDYLDYQPSAEKVKAEREAARERMEKARSAKRDANNDKRSPEVRPNKPRSSDNPVPTRPVKEVPTGTSPPISPEQPKTSPKPTQTDRKRSEVVGEQPFALLESLCDVHGVDVSELGKAQKDKQLGVAKRLVADGVTASDVGKITRWLRSQNWMTGGIDLITVEKYAAKWTLEGKPESVVPNGSMRVVNGGQNGQLDAAARSRERWRKKHGLTPDDPADDDVIETHGRIAQ